jgi:hypothetical protein
MFYIYTAEARIQVWIRTVAMNQTIFSDFFQRIEDSRIYPCLTSARRKAR